MIGGNIHVEIQKKSTEKNEIGERIATWQTVGTALGWLDFVSGDANYQQYNAKIQDTSHVFLCDCKEWQGLGDVKADTHRLVSNGETYEIMMVDNPMNMNKHIEVMLKYVGGVVSG